MRPQIVTMPLFPFSRSRLAVFFCPGDPSHPPRLCQFFAFHLCEKHIKADWLLYLLRNFCYLLRDDTSCRKFLNEFFQAAHKQFPVFDISFIQIGGYVLKPTTLAMILAGGRVDKLNVLTYYRPKSAVPFGGVGRVIDFPLSNLMHSGIERVAILSQYHSYSLINHIGSGSAWDMTGRYRGISILPPFIDSAGAEWYRGSADAVYKNLDFIDYHDPDVVLILSGDHIYNMDYRKLVAYHKQKEADLTVAFIRVPMEKAHRYGVAKINDEDGETGGRIEAYWEKPVEPLADWASLTVLCFDAACLRQALKDNQHRASYEFGRDIIPMLLEQKKKVYGYKFDGYWGYTATVEEYWQSNMDLLGPEPLIDAEKWGLRTNLDHRAIRDFEPTLITDNARVSNSLIYNGCTIEGRVKNSVIFPGVKVGKGTVVENSVLFFNNELGEKCRLNKVVADVNTSYGDSVSIGAASGMEQQSAVTVIGWNNRVPPGCVIGAGATVYPHIPASQWGEKVADGEVVK